MASNQTLKLPNPLTDLAFLPPDAAWQTQIGRYILVGTLGVALAKRFILFVPTETIGLRLIFGTSFLIRTTITSSSHSIGSDWRQSRISSPGMNYIAIVMALSGMLRAYLDFGLCCTLPLAPSTEVGPSVHARDEEADLFFSLPARSLVS
jgi:hypothetical protein